MGFRQGDTSGVRHLFCPLKACGECDFTTKEILVEMLIFQVFEDYYRFPKVDENSRLKVLENKILVSICTTLE